MSSGQPNAQPETPTPQQVPTNKAELAATLYKQFGIPGLLIAAAAWFAPKHFEFMDSMKESNQQTSRGIEKLGDAEQGQIELLKDINAKADHTRDLVKDIHRAVNGPIRAAVEKPKPETESVAQ